MQALECPKCGAPVTVGLTQCTFCKAVFTNDVAETEEAGDADGLESGWRFCTKCDALWAESDKGVGPCAGGGVHVGDEDSWYVLSVDDEDFGGDEGWEWCARCNCLFSSETGGVCAAGGKHDGTESGDYRVACELEDDDAEEEGWRWCSKCHVMFFDEGDKPCAAGGLHDEGDDEYVLTFDLD